MGHTLRLPLLVSLLLVSACGARSELYVGGGGAGGTPSTGGGGTGGVPACVPGTIELKKANPTVLFVIDKSKSMDKSLPGTDSKWQVLKQALSSTLPPVDSTMQIGALLFPTGFGNGFGCGVPESPELTPALGQVTMLLGLLSATGPGGATPTAEAVQSASSMLLGMRAAKSARALVLATDGGPDCNPELDPSTCVCASGTGANCNMNGKSIMCLDDARTIDALSAARDAGAPTYVIGIQSEQNDVLVGVLNSMADAGGRPQSGDVHYYSAKSESELEAALSAIRDQVGACSYLTASVPDDGGSITVTIDGVPVPFDEGAKGEGWSWADKLNGEVLFSGAACAAVTQNPNAVVTAQVGCTN